MKTNMTERDKRLLVGMFLFVIVVAIGYWGILPQLKKFRKLETMIEQEEDDQKINKMKIANAALIEMQADEYEEKIAERKDEFYQVMKSSEVDKMMTELASNRGLDIYDLSFSLPTNPTERMAYQYSDLYNRQVEMKQAYEAAEPVDNTATLTTDTTESGDSSEDSDAESGDSGAATTNKTSSDQMAAEIIGAEEGAYQPNTDIYAVPVTMTVGGDLADLHSFINDIIGIDKRVLLVGYSWGEFRDVIRRDANGNIIRGSQGSASGADYLVAVNNGTDETKTDEGASDSEGEGDSSAPKETVEVVIRKSLTVRLEVYMCDTTDIAASEEGGETVEEAAEGESTDSAETAE